MNRAAPDRGGESDSLEVRVFRRGRLIHRELCESDDQARLTIQEWIELDGVECEVGDLSGPGHADPGDGELDEPLQEDYPERVELDRADADSVKFSD